MSKGPLVRSAIWYGDWDWTITAHERIGGKELAVVSAQFSVPRDPPRDKPNIHDPNELIWEKRRTKDLELA